MASIYNISSWSSAVAYSKNDIVKYSIGGIEYFFYSLANANVNSTPAIASNFWGGVSTFANNITKPLFIWTPSYGFNIDTQPLVRVIRFGEGYEQRLKEGVNNALIKVDLSFEKRNLKESTAIIHFLTEREAAESFIFTTPEPYNIQKLFVARSWNMSQSFANNYNVKVAFEEVPF